MKPLSLSDLEVNHKKALVRVDFNVPMTPDSVITDDTRIQEVLPTIRYLLNQGASVILMSHLGRPKGKKDPKYSLAPIAQRLEKLLGCKVIFIADILSSEAEKICSQLRPKEVVLLENLRFYEAEENPEKDPSFAQKLASYGDVYVDDGFGAMHRAHSSVTEVPKYFPKKSAAGFLVEKELSYLSTLIENPKRDFYALIGGSKISTKMGVLISLLHKVDALFVGGAMAYTFFKAQGFDIGDSLYEEDQISPAKNILEACTKKKIPLHLPVDIVAAKEFNEKAEAKVFPIQDGGIAKGWQGMDIGPQTIQTWKPLLLKAKTLFWNGPLGVFEFKKFSKGTEAIAKILSENRGVTIVGGGDSLAAIQNFGLKEKFTHLSTGGGASLEFLEFGTLPGIEALTQKKC